MISKTLLLNSSNEFGSSAAVNWLGLQESLNDYGGTSTTQRNGRRYCGTLWTVKLMCREAGDD